MTATAARAAAASLRDALRDYGVRTSIELQPGVGPKTDPWGPAPFVRNLGHHVASYPPGTPGLAVVKNGRTGASPLQGPLANCYGGFDLVARIITMGWANHPGAGGPWSVPGWGTVPKDNGRPYILGWEFEGGYLPYTDEMHDFMSRCGAASLDWLGTHNDRAAAPIECHDEHKGWAGPRKPDRVDYTTASGRERISAIRNAPPKSEEDDDMPQLISYSIKPGDELVIPIPPVNSGGAGWGKAWASIVVDQFTRAPRPVPVRVGVMDSKQAYRPMFGPTFDLMINPGTRPVLQLDDGDQAIVVTNLDTEAGVGLLVEYARA